MDEIQQAPFVVEVVDIEDFALQDGSAHLLEYRWVATLEEIKERRGAREQGDENKRDHPQQHWIVPATDDAVDATLFSHGFSRISS